VNDSEPLTTTKLTRQEFLKLSGAGLAGATLLGAAGCRGGSGSAAKGSVFTSYGDTFQRAQDKAWLKPYTRETGTEIHQDSPTDYAKLQDMVENNKVI